MTLFDQVFAIVIGEEGGLSMNASDPGNWTGGACGRGLCHGTKYGIAASAHPDLDIPAITLDQARTIYRVEYWAPIQGDALPPPLALLVFDGAVNCGVQRAIKWLQAAVGCTADGTLGQVTLAAVTNHAGTCSDLCAEYTAQRLSWMTALPTWRTFSLGWSRRLARLPYQSLTPGAP